MHTESLQQKFSDPSHLRDALRNSPTGFYVFPVPDEHTNWRDEQRAWDESAVLFDQSYHMSDIYLQGPDRFRLLSDLSINDFSQFDPMTAKQMVNCADDGCIIGDAIVLHLADSQLNIIGKPPSGNWVSYIAETEDYDVVVTHTPRILESNSKRQHYRFQIQGPNALDILNECNGSSLPETRFFGMCEFSIGGCAVTGLRHGMAAAPGMEFWGPYDEKELVLQTLLDVGDKYGVKRGGGRTYSTAGPQSGWVGAVLPAIYTSDSMQPYREWLPADGYEGMLSIGGSLICERIEDYYMDPWDLGYHRLINWNHEFKGRTALLQKQDRQHRKKVWLKWNEDDVIKIFASMFKRHDKYKHLETPAAHYATIPYDKVEKNGCPIGVSIYAAYTISAMGWFSIGILNEYAVEYGEQVQITWGEPEGVTDKLTVEPHIQTQIRATISRSANG